MPSNDEINAAFDALQIDLRQLVADFVPAFFQGQASQALNSQQGRVLVVDGIRKALTAAEKVRAAAPPVPPPHT
jgi:hypothetical protein